MGFNKVSVHNKVIFIYFDYFSYQKQLSFIKKIVKIAEYDFVIYTKFLTSYDGIIFSSKNYIDHFMNPITILLFTFI